MSRANPPPAPPAPPLPSVPEPWRPRFGLGMLLLAMLVVSVIAAAGSYLVRAVQVGSPRSVQFIFILFTLTTPVLVLVAVSLMRQLFHWLERSRRR